jgi:hypothetical protein
MEELLAVAVALLRLLSDLDYRATAHLHHRLPG